MDNAITIVAYASILISNAIIGGVIAFTVKRLMDPAVRRWAADAFADAKNCGIVAAPVATGLAYIVVKAFAL